MSTSESAAQPRMKPSLHGQSAEGRDKVTIIVLGGVLVCLVLVLAAGLVTVSFCCGAPGPYVHVDITISQVGNNWSLIVVRVPVSVSPDDTTLTIRDRDSIVRLPMDHVPLSALTQGNWTTYFALHEGQSGRAEISPGDQIIISASQYQAGSDWWLDHESWTFLSQGILP